MVIPALAFLMLSCEEFLNPDQDLDITEERLFDDWYEYRSVEMGLYAIQQDLVEQLMVLGELRGDLLQITASADADLVEVYNFNISRSNRFASPTTLFKLISACNNFIRILEREHPEVLDPESPVSNYDRLYGEALCMRAWSYFNAARIYGKVPFIPESLVTMEEIDQFLESQGTYIDSVYIDYSRDGYHNDTVYNEPIVLDKHYFNVEQVVDYFTDQLEREVKAVGVNHHIHNNDISWEVTIWNDYAMHALLGQMYLTRGDLVRAAENFLAVMRNPSENFRYYIDYSFSNYSWKNIFTNIDSREHILTVWFDKTYFQQNQFQRYFEPWVSHQYMMKPTYNAILYWESVWRGQWIDKDVNDPGKSKMAEQGTPSDFYRGYGFSYLYVRNGIPLEWEDFLNMVNLRADGDSRSSGAIMEGMDTIVFKYSIGRDVFGQDANYIIYRAAGIHFYMAEIYTYWAYEQNDILRTNTTAALGILNDGSYYTLDASRREVGIRGRVGLAGGIDGISVGNINYIHDPFTNEIIGYLDLTHEPFIRKQEYLEERMLEEKAREMAFEGERFYDLMRVARRREDPSFLARAVSSKFPPGKREQIYDHLLDESNWYISYFEE